MTSGTSQISLYNTLTRTKEPFVPLDANNVRMYVCGPTVYDFAHIGNARPVIVFDVLFRLLRHAYGEGNVTYVRNITDVDDKINARALRDFPDLPLNEAIRRVTEKTETQFLADVAALGTLEPNVQPRATDNIAQMQTIIAELIARRHAYDAAGEVLFDTSSMADYGQLSGRNLEDNLAGARIAVDAHKKNPADFVLWKQSSATEPGWDSPWGRGRPGWHIECSAMSERYLGQTFDIHGGGLDLIFPHHENEIAQSRCAHGTHAMANVWMHNGFLQVEGQKMSKSMGNFVTINDLLQTGAMGGHAWHGDVLRLAMLMTHYREPIDFSLRRLEEAEAKLRDWQRAARGAERADDDAPRRIRRDRTRRRPQFPPRRRRPRRHCPQGQQGRRRNRQTLPRRHSALPRLRPRYPADLRRRLGRTAPHRRRHRHPPRRPQRQGLRQSRRHPHRPRRARRIADGLQGRKWRTENQVGEQAVSPARGGWNPSPVSACGRSTLSLNGRGKARRYPTRGVPFSP